MLAKLLLFLIKIYQKTISPDSGWFKVYFPHGFCRFYPHCSEYCYQAIDKYGAFKGLFKGLARILRCHPFNDGGFDPLK